MESLYIYQNLENYGMTFNNHQQCNVWKTKRYG